MASNWLRLEAKAAFLGWTSRLPAEQYAAWIKLLQVIKAFGEPGGRIKQSYFDDEELGQRRLSRHAFEKMLSAAQEASAISITAGGDLSVTKWGAYQVDITASDRQRKHRDRQTTAPKDIPSDREIMERDGHCCAYCGNQNSLVIDHVIPRAQGGRGTAENLVTACRSCNSKKGNKTPEQAGLPWPSTLVAPVTPEDPCHADRTGRDKTGREGTTTKEPENGGIGPPPIERRDPISIARLRAWNQKCVEDMAGDGKKNVLSLSDDQLWELMKRVGGVEHLEAVSSNTYQRAWRRFSLRKGKLKTYGWGQGWVRRVIEDDAAREAEQEAGRQAAIAKDLAPKETAIDAGPILEGFRALPKETRDKYTDKAKLHPFATKKGDNELFAAMMWKKEHGSG